MGYINSHEIMGMLLPIRVELEVVAQLGQARGYNDSSASSVNNYININITV
jgi:hypothetical protein